MGLAAYGLPSADSLNQVQSFDCLKTSKEKHLEIEVRNFVNEFFFGMEEGYRGISRASYLLKEHKPNQRPVKAEVDQFNIAAQCLAQAPDTTCSIVHCTAAILNNANREEMATPFESSIERTPVGAQTGIEEVLIDMFQRELPTCEEQPNKSIDWPNHVDLRIVPPLNDGAMHLPAKYKVEKQIRRMETFPCSANKTTKVQCTGATTADQCPIGIPATMEWASKPSCKKPPRPPRPISDPLRDRLTRSFSDNGLKLARFEKSRSKRRKLAASASNAVSVWALLVTFFIIVILVAQGLMSQHSPLLQRSSLKEVMSTSEISRQSVSAWSEAPPDREAVSKDPVAGNTYVRFEGRFNQPKAVLTSWS